jgi:hypothetical protein
MRLCTSSSSLPFRAACLSVGAVMLGMPMAAWGVGTVVNFHAADNGAAGPPNFDDILYVGQGAASDPGNNFWNGFGPGFHADTNGANATSTGAATPVTLSIAPPVGTNGGLSFDGPDGNGGNTHQGTPFFLLGHCNLVNDANPGIGMTGAPLGQFTFNNVPQATYDVYLYGANYDSDRGAVFTLSSGTADSGITGTVNNHNNDTFTLGTNYVIFHNVVPNAQHQIVGTWAPNPASMLQGEGNFNAVQLVAPNIIVVEPEWGVNSSGDWNVAANWIGGVPNGVGAVAKLLTHSSAPHTVFTDAPVTLGTLRIENAATYVVGGSGSLTMQVATGSGSINVSGGSHKINLPLTFASNTTINVESGATLRISDPVTVNASRTVLQSGAGNALYESTVDVLGGGGIQFRSASHFNRLSLNAGATATLLLGGTNAMKIDTVALNATSTMDMNDNDLVTSTAKSTIIGVIRSARNGGAWNGPGMTSTAAKNQTSHATMLGVLSGAEYSSVGGTGVFGGQNYAPTDTLVKYTWYGDTDFNGRVNFDDYVRTDNGFNNHLSGWLNGDFDLNGQVNFDDYVLIDLAFNTQSGTLKRALSFIDGSDRSAAGMSDPALQRLQQHFDEFGGDYGSHFLSAVPEPASLGLVAGALLLAGPRQRRRRV